MRNAHDNRAAGPQPARLAGIIAVPQHRRLAGAVASAAVSAEQPGRIGACRALLPSPRDRQPETSQAHPQTKLHRIYTRPIGLASAFVFGGLVGVAAVPAAAAPATLIATAPPICMVDRGAILTRSKPATAMGLQFQQRRQALQGAYDITLRAIESDARMLASLKASLPPAVAKARDEEIARRRMALARDTERANQQLAALNESLKGRLLDAAGPIIHDIAAAQGCAAVMPSEGVIVLDRRADLTEAVLGRLATLAPPTQMLAR